MIMDQHYRTFIVSGRTDIGKCRSINEDGFVITSIPSDEAEVAENDIAEERVLLVVADGSGGSEAGSLACELIQDYLLQELKAEWRGENSIEALRIAIERSNSHLYKRNQENHNHNYFAAITAVLIEGEMASIAQVGDTRAYLMRDEQLVQVTIDQTMVYQLLQKGILTKEQEKSFSYSTVVLQVLGCVPEITVALTQVRLRQNDQLLLCSDGLWRKVSQDEIKEILSSDCSVAEACEKMIKSALKKGTEDNVTVVIAEAPGKALPQSVESESPDQMFTILTELEDMQGMEEWRLSKEKDK
jgi:serine/threonine protein phosphatase PrpC